MCCRSNEDYREDLYWGERAADEESFSDFVEREMNYEESVND